ncbi:MAG: WecB/TagA/CpsF family glycosyltransferase [Polaribacter sp.]|nr:WecB/TagA/CpsF family glycosyltransferase [Polaribacter sp.]
MKKYYILGAPCYQVNSVKVVKGFIKGLINSGKGGYSVAINAEKIMMYSEDAKFKTILDNSVLPIPDGSGATIGMKILHSVNSLKLDFPKIIFECANENNFSFFILGAEEKVNKNAEMVINQKYSGINVVGRQNGYFEDESILFKQIKLLKPQIVMIALGSPKQEELAVRLHMLIPSALLIGCGGALNILTGEVKRAPRFFQDNHLEWFYRLAKEPFRFKRQLILPIFLGRLIIEKIKIKSI